MKTMIALMVSLMLASSSLQSGFLGGDSLENSHEGRHLQVGPQTLDWVWQGLVNSPRPMGSCNADFAMAITSAIEG